MMTAKSDSCLTSDPVGQPSEPAVGRLVDEKQMVLVPEKTELGSSTVIVTDLDEAVIPSDTSSVTVYVPGVSKT